MNKRFNFGGNTDFNTGKMYLGGGMHFPSAASFIFWMAPVVEEPV